jgi:hypothetical protein
VTAACTIVAKNQFALGRVLASSFRAHHPEIPFFVLLADEIDGCFDPGREPFETIPLSALDIPDSGRFRFRYAQQPLSYACTPFLIEHLLARGFERVVFFKQEGMVLGSHADVIDRLARHPIVLTAHLIAPLDGHDAVARELNILQSGIFNVGLLAVAESGTARRFLRWWQDRVSAHCRHAIADGMHYEQRWLDLIPSYFDGSYVMRDPAFNVAHWNLPERAGQPCRLFRFSGYDPDSPAAPTRYADRLTWEAIGPARSVFDRYRRALLDAGHEETRTWPYAYAFFDDGTPVPDFVRRLYVELGEAAARFPEPRAVTSSPSFFGWLNEPVDARRPSVSRLWHAVHAARRDLQHAFPDVLDADRERFVAWTHASGEREHDIPPPFHLPASSVS